MGLFRIRRTSGATAPADRAPRTEARTPSGDELAVQRYEYLLRTAPPETIEHVHTEAFARLTEAQRDLLFNRLLENAPDESARPADPRPAALARAATRAEILRPGTVTAVLSAPRAPGVAEALAASLLWDVAAYSIASTFVGLLWPAPGWEHAGAADDVDLGADGW